MSGRTLKKYDKYIQKIEMWAKVCGIKIIKSDKHGEGSFLGKTIRIDPNLTESYEIAILLHELGHSLDDAMIPYRTQVILQKAYGEIERSPSKKQVKIVLKCERRAWEYGKVIARRIGIKLGKWYDEARKDCLKTYASS